MMGQDKQTGGFKQVAAFVTIPFVLAVTPFVGWLLGRWLDKQLNTAPYLMYVLLFLGFVSGVRECYRIIKEYNEKS